MNVCCCFKKKEKDCSDKFITDGFIRWFGKLRKYKHNLNKIHKKINN